MPYNYHGNDALEFDLMVEAGMNEMDAIMADTSNAAELLDWQDEISSVSPGLYADLIAVAGNPLDDISLMRSVVFVMKGGEMCWDRRPGTGNDLASPG